MDLKLIVKLERRLTDLINFLKQEISKKDLNELEEYRDVGEYGLCLETIAGVIYENKIRIPKSIYKLICETGNLMQMEDSSWTWIEDLVELEDA